ncbi:uncharacterized protein PG998_010603 [Apiospora kogelbergensis]|uniref:uncharacterized protein n=1 Tax=Apiospora kogelbergensis TaxID=1337665 RepID=UPI00312FE2E9
MDGAWEPGYWEIADETGEHAAPPEKLEHEEVLPSRCSLWMKLIVYSQGLVSHVTGAYEPRDFREMSVQDGWAYGRDAWLSCMELMSEAYAHPPDREASWTAAVPTKERHEFRQSLSDCQLRSWELLRDWWDGKYQDSDLTSRARAFILRAPLENIDSIRHKDSIYQEVLFSLWNAEFNPAGWSTGTSRGTDANRRMAYEHALTQKAGFLVVRGLKHKSQGLEQEECDKDLPGCYDICPWLPKEPSSNQNPDSLPLYLWDTTEKRTRLVKELLQAGIAVEYTCISHTWGRWKKKPPKWAQVIGVPWQIPENNLYEVEKLPTILLQANCQTRFVWFDLVCLPQDVTSPDYQSEVARQATIFHQASTCIAWVNKVTSWTNLQASIQWLCLYFLYAGSASDLYISRGVLRESEAIDSPIELIGVNKDGQGEFEAWITSTWTLQESCLCPDVVLCDKQWRPLEVVEGSPVGLHQLFTIWSVCREAHFAKPIDARDWPLPVQQLLYAQSVVCGKDVEISRLAILSLGATRECEMRRADAVMSAMGVTEWYETYLEEHNEAPPDADMVLDAYPLRFINAAVSKIGSIFFSSFNPDVLALEDEDLRGTLLPFGRPGLHLTSGTGLALSQSWYSDTSDHPSLKTWVIKIDGSVLIREAAVLSLRYLSTSSPVGCLFNISGPHCGNETFHRDMQKFLHEDPEVRRMALVLNTIRDTTNGIILQSRRAGWISIGNWDTRQALSNLPVEKLNITVL